VSRVTASPGRKLAYLLAVLAVTVAGAVSLAAPPAAEAAKPCWKRLIDDWVDNGGFDNKYSAACIDQARKHLPEDIRAYSDIEEKIDGLLLLATRQPALVKPSTSKPSPPQTRDGNGQPAPQPTATTNEPKPGPFEKALNPTQTNADSIPLPLILLAGLALILMAAGASGIAHRKLQARRAAVRRPS
jgi:hypothetical protein